ncbi:hypothetical protein RchiOBHm_Chr6g0281261 [Rosa chinensis]|uniref:Uncharacterized protein n=1 Tax=Rosa chinensis TaxID=74649 RepID=A0A2P6PTL2_ROSCH|nr:hypothetical protein RchiOBHm_Chr6g0281261 [Rosa chinensis]
MKLSRLFYLESFVIAHVCQSSIYNWFCADSYEMKHQHLITNLPHNFWHGMS